jgi:hypothetical protein
MLAIMMIGYLCSDQAEGKDKEQVFATWQILDYLLRE